LANDVSHTLYTLFYSKIFKLVNYLMSEFWPY